MIGGGGGSPGGTNAGLMLPPNQGPAAQGFQDLTTPLYNQGINAFNQMGGTSPAQNAWPYVWGSASNIISNPYQQGPVQGGQTAADIFQNQMLPQGMQAGGTLSNLGNLMAGQAGGVPGLMNNPAYAQAGQFGQQFAPQLMQAGQSLLNAGFDPRQELYNRTAQQIRDQQNAINAQSGVAQTPYGAGIAGQRMQDFNIDWQNQQLQRQALAGPAAMGMFGGAQQGLIGPANAQLAAQQAGTGILDQLTRGTGAGLTVAQNLYSGLAQAAPGMMGAPYNAQNQIQQANLSALQNMIGLGNAMYQPGQQAVSNLGQYMGLGQTASQIANQIGQTNFNQASALGQGAMQGLGGLSSLLGGGGGLFGGGAGGAGGLGLSGMLGATTPGLFSVGGLLGSQGPLLGTAADLSIAAGGPPLAAEAAKAAPLAMASDRRFKTDIERLGQLDYGPAIYSFKYKGSDKPQIGLMADEVEAFNPDAVLRDQAGYGYVDYSRAIRPT